MATSSFFSRERGPSPRGRRLRPEDARRHNRQLVLRTLHREDGLSRADIARETGLSPVTISDLVGELVSESLVVESGRLMRTGRGAPSRALALVPGARNVVIVSITSGAGIEGVITDLRGTILTREVSPGAATGAAAVDEVLALVERLMPHATAPVLGIGISTPGVVDGDGVVLRSTHFDWQDVPLRSLVAERAGVPVTVANGVAATALGELIRGGTDHDLLHVRAGAGVGAVAVINGAVVHGRNWTAGELGHVVIDEEDAPRCVCGRYGCLEAWLSAPRLTARASEATDDGERTHVLRRAGHALGAALTPLVATLGLTDIVLSGPEALLAGPLIDQARATLVERTLSQVSRDLTIRIVGDDADLRRRGVHSLVLAQTLGI